jgi:hypothetical protein
MGSARSSAGVSAHSGHERSFGLSLCPPLQHRDSKGGWWTASVIYLCTLLEIALVISCVALLRSWRGGGGWLETVTTAPRLGPPRRYPGAFAAAYPAESIGFILFAGGGVMLMWSERLGLDLLFTSAVAGVLVLLGIATCGAAGCVYLFMRPVFLVPPPFRDSKGRLSSEGRNRGV